MLRMKEINLALQHFKQMSRHSSTFVKELTIADIPHPFALPVVGTKLNFLITGSGTSLHEYVDRQHKKLGPIFYDSLGGNTELIFISDPNMIKHLFLSLEGKYPAHILPDSWLLYEKLYGSSRGLLFMNGEEWLTNRRVLNKCLLRDNADAWLEAPVSQTIEKFIEKWKTDAVHTNLTPDLETEFYRLSTNTIISVLLGKQNCSKISLQNEELMMLFADTVKRIFHTTTKLYSLPVSWLQQFDLKLWRDFKQSVDLSLFLATKIVQEMLESKHDNDGLIKKLSDENISDEMITRIVADFVIAAGDTSAYTTLWTLHLLAKHKNIIEEMRMNKTLSVRSILKESMRLYPVAPFLTRILTKPCLLNSYQLKEGTPIIASVYSSSRDEQNFSRASEFLPYRWERNDERKQTLANHVPFASLPFAHGARSCIGKKIAMLQLTGIISEIVNNFDMESQNTTEIKPMTSQILVPNQKISIQFSLRNKKC